MEKPLYVLKTSEIFPYDAEQTDYKVYKKNISNTLRPEFILNYPYEIKSDTMKDYQNLQIGFKNPNYKIKDIYDLSEASKYLKTQIIPSFVEKLDDLELMPIDTESLTSMMHEYGINMRYLSFIACLTKIFHIR